MNTVLQEAHKCDMGRCGNQHIQLKTTQLLFEVVHDVEGGRKRAVYFGCWEKRDKARRNETSPCILRIVQAQGSISRWRKIALYVEGDADRLA